MMPCFLAWPKTILHLDANAFFASVAQAANPKLKGKPVVIGAERGLATAISYEAKVFGIKRGMLMSEIKRVCPKVIILPGDYKLFSLFSQKMFTLLKQYSPIVEQYSIDEGFLDLFGLIKPSYANYQALVQKIQTEINKKLGLPVSIGVSVNKSLAKLASGFVKPQGITIVSKSQIPKFLNHIPLIRVWGIGPATAKRLAKFNIRTAWQFASLEEQFFAPTSLLKLNKSLKEIYLELQGQFVYQLKPEAKTHYQSISKTATFHPPSNNSAIVWAHLLKNIELAFKKTRQYGYFVQKVFIFLKTQQFRYSSIDIKLEQKQQYPLLFRQTLYQAFLKIFKPNLNYRATGVILSKFSNTTQEQISLFSTTKYSQKQKAQAIYQALQEQPKVDFGTSLYLKTQPSPQSRILPHFNIPVLEI